MKDSWTRGLNEEQKLEIHQAYAEALFIRAKLSELLNKKIRSDNSAAISKSSYESPNWAYMQADSIGYQRALQEVLDLIGFPIMSKSE